METEKQESQENTNNKEKETRDKVLSLIFGDLNKWRKLPMAIEELKREIKTKKGIELILIFIFAMAITMSFMYAINYFQKNAQYCELQMNAGFCKYSNYKIDYFTENNKSYSYYEQLFEENLGLAQCTSMKCYWDIGRFKDELLK